MKITIDTQTDTYEDIKKVLHLLTNTLKRQGHFDDLLTTNSATNLTTTPNPEAEEKANTGFMNMFADQPTLTTKKEEPPQLSTAPDFNSFLSLLNKKEDEKKVPKVELF